MASLPYRVARALHCWARAKERSATLRPLQAPAEGNMEIRRPDGRRSPERLEDGQVRCGDAVDAQPGQLVEALAVVDRPRQNEQFVPVHPGNQVRVHQVLEDRYTTDGLLERGVGL